MYAEDRDFVRLHVKDNGSGISKDKQKSLVKRFYEGDYRKFNTIGTGIGLSLVKDLVELHGGSIEVESEEGRGTEFIVTLPVDRSYFKEEQMRKLYFRYRKPLPILKRRMRRMWLLKSPKRIPYWWWRTMRSFCS